MKKYQQPIVIVVSGFDDVIVTSDGKDFTNDYFNDEWEAKV